MGFYLKEALSLGQKLVKHFLKDQEANAKFNNLQAQYFPKLSFHPFNI